MTDGGTFSPTDEGLSPNHDLVITMEEGSENSEQVLEIEGSDPEVYGADNNDLDNDVLIIENNDEQVLEFGNNDHDQMLNMQNTCIENEKDSIMDTIVAQNGISEEKTYAPPVIGSEFESYEDAYNYYNCYAKEVGFAIRVKSSWTKRNSKEKRGAVLCCNCEGFKTIKEATTRRKETRTGCLAMIRLRLVWSNRWRIDEVKLEHNHLFDPERAQCSKSHKKMDNTGGKRKLEANIDVQVRTIKLYRTSLDRVGPGSSNEGDSTTQIDQSKRLNLKEGDSQAITTFFSKLQLTDPNFFYIMDINDEGYLKNVLWIESRSRSLYLYFGDVISINTEYISKEYEIPLVTFNGVNHHNQTILLGCAFLVDKTLETYIWLLRAWLTCMRGRTPQTVITEHCKFLQSAISEVFPRANHRFRLSHVMQKILDKSGDLGQLDIFCTLINRTVYNSIKAEEFEIGWQEIIQHFGVSEHEWFQILYHDREKWAPVYIKDTFFAGLRELLVPFFEGYIHKETTLKEFVELYESVSREKCQKEALDDIDSKEYNPVFKTRCNYELQLSKVYTKEIFTLCQNEMEMMCNCFSIVQIQANGSIITYVVHEKETDEEVTGHINFEVIYDKVSLEIRCICSCFNFKGYLCRHALSVLSYNGVEEIPNQYILSRWRKDFKRLYSGDYGSNCIDISNPVQWFSHLYRKGMQVVEEGISSQDHYMVAWQAFKESLNKVRLVTEKQDVIIT